MTIALLRPELAPVPLPAEPPQPRRAAAPPARTAPRRGLLATLRAVVAGLAFAEDWGRKVREIDRLRARSDAALAARGYDRGQIVAQVFWFELAR